MTVIENYLTTPYHYRSMSMPGEPWRRGRGASCCDGCLRVD